MTTGSVIRDQNRTPIWWGLSSVDGITLVPIQINASTGKVEMEIGTTNSATVSTQWLSLPRDENRVVCIGGASKNNSAVILPVSVNPATGAILAQTT